MKKLLLVVDVQNDFINDDTKVLLHKISNLIDSNKFDKIAFTRFINCNKSRFFKDLHYKRCLTKKGTAIAIDTKDYKIFNKTTYTALTEELRKYLKKEKIDQIYLCGLDTNACILETALDLFEQDYDFYILKDYCMSSSSKKLHNNAINNLKVLVGDKRIV